MSKKKQTGYWYIIDYNTRLLFLNFFNVLKQNNTRFTLFYIFGFYSKSTFL